MAWESWHCSKTVGKGRGRMKGNGKGKEPVMPGCVARIRERRENILRVWERE